MARVVCAVLVVLASCAVRPPAPVNIDALLAARGPIEARRELQIRVTADRRDVAGRLALAELDERIGRPSEAIDALEAVVALGGPVGVRWHAEDQARLARLIAARGRARLARGAATALTDLQRARSLGATVAEGELRAARIAIALEALHHSDSDVRDMGRRTLALAVAGDPMAAGAALPATPSVDSPSTARGVAGPPMATAAVSMPRSSVAADSAVPDAWAGAREGASPEQRGRFGAWLWQNGARAAAWDELAAWHAATRPPRDPALQTAYLIAARWWIPLDRPAPPAEDLVGPARCAFAACAPRDVLGDEAAERAYLLAPLASPVRDSLDAAAVAAITLRQALRGEAAWGEALAARVDIAAVAEPAQLAKMPRAAQPIFARLAGRDARIPRDSVPATAAPAIAAATSAIAAGTPATAAAPAAAREAATAATAPATAAAAPAATAPATAAAGPATAAAAPATAAAAPATAAAAPATAAAAATAPATAADDQLLLGAAHGLAGSADAAARVDALLAGSAYAGSPYAESLRRVVVGGAPFSGDPVPEAVARHAELTVTLGKGAIAPDGTGHAARADALRAMVVAYRRDPLIADRLGRDAVAETADAAGMYATLGALFDTLGDPARARAAWQAAVDASAEPSFVRGLAEAQARQGDADAALITATNAAAASGDPAVVWTCIARALVEAGKYAHALEAVRSAIDLAGPETLPVALDVAVAASRALSRDAQADSLARRRAQLAPGENALDDRQALDLMAPASPPASDSTRTRVIAPAAGDSTRTRATAADGDPTSARAALAAYRRDANGASVERLWVASRWNARHVAIRVALLAALGREDAKRGVVVGELVQLAADRDPDVRRAAIAALGRER